jgi:hypothetical protein
VSANAATATGMTDRTGICISLLAGRRQLVPQAGKRIAFERGKIPPPLYRNQEHQRRGRLFVDARETTIRSHRRALPCREQHHAGHAEYVGRPGIWLQGGDGRRMGDSDSVSRRHGDGQRASTIATAGAAKLPLKVEQLGVWRSAVLQQRGGDVGASSADRAGRDDHMPWAQIVQP